MNCAAVVRIVGLAVLAACGSDAAGTDDERPRPATVSLAPDSLTLASVGATRQLTATVRDQNGATMASPALIWSTADASVASVTSTGLVTAVANGNAMVTASSGNATGSSMVTVAQRVATISVAPATFDLVLGGTRQLTAALRDGEGTEIAGKQITWNTSASAVATVTEAGLVRGVGNGSATISATADAVVGSATVTVGTVTVEVSPAARTLTAAGQTVQLAATVRDHAGSVVPGALVTWSSSDENVATVNSSGLVAAINNGTSTIEAETTGGAAGSAMITVSIATPSVDLIWERELEAGVSFADIWGSSGANVLAIGSTYGLPGVATIWRNRGSGWKPEPFDGVGRALYGIWGSSETSVFVVGSAGAGRSLVLRFDGMAWTSALNQPGQPLFAVWGSSATDVFAVGKGGVILHFDGASWMAHSSGTTKDLHAIWGTSSTNVYAVGADGTVLHYDGARWVPRASGTTARLRGVWGSSPTDVYAAGGRDPNVGPPGAGVIVRFDGTTWTPQHVGTQGFTRVWGTSASNVFAIGGDPSYNPSPATVYRFDGMTWTLQQGGGADGPLHGIWGSSASDVYAVAGDSRILRYDGTGWTAETLWRTAAFTGFSGTGANDIYAVGAGSIEYFQRPTPTKILRGSETGWRTVFLGALGEQLTATWSGSPASAFAVGGRTGVNSSATGFILRFDGIGWTRHHSVPAIDLLGIWGSSPTDVFAVGTGGTILHYDGVSWTSQTSGTTLTLTAIWGASANRVFAVGLGGTVLRYDGSTWTPMPSGTTGDLYDIWGTSENDVFVVGAAGMIRHFNGTTWTPHGATANNLYAVWGVSGTDVFAVGEAGTILHYDGASWRRQQSGTTQILLSVWGTSSTNVFVGGVSLGGSSSILHGTRTGS